jgi:hypothetical protein
MVEVDFCENFGINNIINPMTTTFVSHQMRWLDSKNNGLSLRRPRFNFVTNSISMLTIYEPYTYCILTLNVYVSYFTLIK